MTGKSIEELSQPRLAGGLSQATQVEQARAASEVQAAVMVAQNVPRNLERARQQMLEACAFHELAEKATYAVPKRGTGPSVHLARELARCFGNIQHGVVELRRDDEAGISEIQAFAWDVENNTRSVRSFIVPHARMAGGRRNALVDLTDIVNNNNNAGARAVRETIFHVLPVGFVEQAKAACAATLARGQGEPLPVRIENAIAQFAKGGVTVAQLEARLGYPRSKWDEGDAAELGVIFRSLKAGETTKEEQFPTDSSVTAAEITGADQPIPESAFPDEDTKGEAS